MKIELETLATGFGYLEGPRVDDEDNLYFADPILGGVYKRTPDGSITTYLKDRLSIGGLALNHDGALIVSGRGGPLYFNPRTGEQRIIAGSYGDQPIDTINDIQPDGRGGIYAGLIDGVNYRAGRPQKGCPLLRIDPSGSVTRMWEGIVGSNGMGLSPDGSLLYQCESEVGIWAYLLAPDGRFATRKLMAPIRDCDGMAVDTENCVWVARYGSGDVVRFRPDGSIDSTIPIPIKQVLSLTFGGSDLRDLYIVTASDFETRRGPMIGTIFRLRSPVAGLRTPRTRF